MAIRDRRFLGGSWLSPGQYQISPRLLEIVEVGGIFVVLVLTRFYAVNRLPGVWDAETCPHRPIAASWSRIIEQELGAHVQQSSGMLWVVLHNLFTRVNDPLLFFLDERLVGVNFSTASTTSSWMGTDASVLRQQTIPRILPRISFAILDRWLSLDATT